MAKFPPDDDALPDPPAGSDPRPSVPMPTAPAPAFGGGGLDVLEDVKRIEQRTSSAGRLAALGAIVLLVVVGGVGLFVGRGYWTRWDEWQQVRSLPLEQQPPKLRDILARTSYDDVRQEIIAELAMMRDVESVPHFIEALDTPGIVRREAAKALSAIGSPRADSAKPKLLAVLPSVTDVDREAVVWALAVLNEPQALDAILREFTAGNLQDEEGFEPRIITRVVGRERLASLVGHESHAVRMLVAQALSEIASGEVVPPLIQLLGDSDGEVVRQAAAGLGRTGDPRSGPPLVALMQKQPRMREGIMESLRQSTSALGLGTVLPAVTDPRTRRELVKMIREAHDPRAGDILAAQLTSDDPEIRSHAAMGLAEIGDARAVAPLAQLMQDTSDEAERTTVGAINALGDLGDRSAMQPLLRLLPRYSYRRAVILKALGACGDAAIGPTVAPLLDSDDSAAAAQALARVRYDGTYRDILTMATRPPQLDMSERSRANEEILIDRTGAIRALGWYGRAEAADTLITIVKDPQDDIMLLRGLAAEELGSVANAQVQQRVLAEITNAQTDPYAREQLVHAFWRRPSAELAPRLLELMRPPQSAEVRRSAAIAVGYAAVPALREPLREMLADAEGRRYAAIAIILGGDAASARALMRVFAEDRETLELTQQYITNQENDWFTFITQQHLESGTFWARLAVTRALRDGIQIEGRREPAAFSWAWEQFIDRLKSGSAVVPDGLNARAIRRALWDGLRGDDAERRTLAAEALGAMMERGLLLASRDLGGNGSEEARSVLRRMNQADTSEQTQEGQQGGATGG
ncbi:MAG: HEAT repeat domain-containing protein [Deltaproteobacteria bacterium]|nr:HEAT repeat domain-containing protein [Deltaproteobacteria bacterium]